MTRQEFTLGRDRIDPETVATLYGVGPLYREELPLGHIAPAGDSTWGLLRRLAEDEWRRHEWWRRPVKDAALEAWERLVCPECARVRYSPACLTLAPFHRGDAR